MGFGFRVVSVLAVLVCSGLAGTHWAQTRVEAEVKQLLAGLQPALANAVHGPISVNLWDRSVTIPDLVLTPRQAAGAAETATSAGSTTMATTMASVMATGVAITLAIVVAIVVDPADVAVSAAPAA
jgi:hypothetical protein